MYTSAKIRVQVIFWGASAKTIFDDIKEWKPHASKPKSKFHANSYKQNGLSSHLDGGRVFRREGKNTNIEEFRNPGKIYRPSPFWSWNDALDIRELRWQVQEFADKGFGGYFMHSRVGLATPYLSKEWMDCIRACLEEGKKVNVESWLYDEDKWPSGFAGGFVPAKGDNYRARSIRMSEIAKKEVPKALRDPSVLGVFEVQFSLRTKIKNYKRIQKLRDITGKGVLLQFRVEISQRSNWYNGESYVDLLNPKVTREFLKVTLDSYAEKFRKDFVEFIPGIFTDEPNYVGRSQIPWTKMLPKYFKKMNGYDIIEKLPLLYFEGVGFRKVRYDFRKTVTQLFVEAFTRPYAKRCARYGLNLSGHYLSEDNLDSQTRAIGAAMPHYEYMQVPGVDHLGRNINDPLTLKQCSSVAHQFGRARILSELFGCSGHSMTFEDQKWIGDFHLALGITFFCPHLTLYTMKGDGKRDYPPTFSYHQPYWEYLKLINDYFARASYLCSQGRFCADILVLHPIGSAWATFTPVTVDRETLPWRYNNSLVKILEDLLASHRGFDFGDEIILSRHGRVEGKEFIVKEGRYKVVIVPPSLTWSSATFNLLHTFIAERGIVIFVGETPGLIDGKHGEERWLKLFKNLNVIRVGAEREALAKVLDNILPRSVAILGVDGREIEDILVHHRVEGSKNIYFFANRSRTKRYDATIKFSEKGEVTEWDMFTGSVLQVEAITQDDNTIIKTVLHPAGSRAFVIDASKPPILKGTLTEKKVEEKVIQTISQWEFSRLHPNTLVLDSCEYSFDDEEWGPKTAIWKVRREAWRKCGLEEYTGIQPWVLLKKKVKPKRLKVNMRTRFKSEVEGKKIFLVLECAPIWKLIVNGTKASTKVKEWHWDKQFGKVDISEKVKIGENTIELSCRYGLDVPIEDMYLIGNFGVKKISETEYVITEEAKTLKNGDWAQQGYPFYSGTMRYKAKFNIGLLSEPREKVFVRLPNAKGTLFLLYVNGKGPLPVCWSPLEANVTEFIEQGENDLTVDVVSSLRNTFGPLHHSSGDLLWVGPSSFTDEANWVDAYQFVPYGLIGGAEIVIRREVSEESEQGQRPTT